MSSRRRRRVVFVHPDLGVGGAERLVVDAAVGLQSSGYEVSVFTSRHDSTRCFSETSDGTLDVRVYGDFLPRHLFGTCHLLCAWLRHLWLCFALIVVGGKFDAAVVDQISLGVPLLQLVRRRPVLFYCHFPDKLLSLGRHSLLKRLYRAPIDWLEERTTAAADVIFANSAFTRATTLAEFRSIDAARLRVLYPGVNLERYDLPANLDGVRDAVRRAVDDARRRNAPLLLSINRFERKKRLDVALVAAAAMARRAARRARPAPHLMMCGGYDDAVAENVEHFAELEQRATELGVREHVTFVRSFSDDERAFLLQSAALLLYTPPNEHFGIVPLEAMYSRVPVVACASGGPRETVLDGVTGRLCDECDGEAFGRAADDILLAGEPARRKMGDAGRARVVANFTLAAFTKSLVEQIEATLVHDEQE
jgi:alpha-1,3/alpha-1,6-mannosyltransferase